MSSEENSSAPDDTLRAYAVHRGLSEPIFRIRALGILRLTDRDIVVCVMAAAVFWNIIDLAGLSRQPMFFGIKYDPWGWWGFGLVVALGISRLRKIRPEGDIMKVLEGWVAARNYAPRTPRGDRAWQPGTTRGAGSLTRFGLTERRKKG